MVIFMYAGNRTLALKVTLISTAILSMAVLVTILPSFTDFSVFNELVPSSLLNIVSLILRPPYLYIFVNFIIVSILASTKLHKPHDHHPTAAVKSTQIAATTIVDNPYNDITGVVYGYGVDVVGQEPISDDGREVEKVIIVDGGDEMLKDVVRIDSMEIRVMDEKLELFKQKVKEKEKDRPLSSTRFKPDKTGYEGFNGKALRVLSKPKRDDTLESTWRTITDGRSMPLTRHLKKVETWEADAHVQNDKTTPQVKKSETFNTSKDATNSPSINISSSLRREPSLKLKKDPSLSQDELNRRVEAFINKFNEEMRLQRQQSLMNQEMLKYGVMQ